MDKKLITAGALLFTATGVSLLTKNEQELGALETPSSELTKVEDYKAEMSIPQMTITDSNPLTDSVFNLHAGLLLVGLILIVLGLRIKRGV